MKSPTSVSPEEQAIISQLNASFVWLADYIDHPPPNTNTAGLLTHFTRTLTLSSSPSTPSIIHITADTRYKLLINSQRIAVGPCRSSPQIWYYDTIDISPFLKEGENEIEVVVLRYFNANRAAMPFERTPWPGLSVVGEGEMMELGTKEEGWKVWVDEGVEFPMGVPEDVFLHISERVSPKPEPEVVTPKLYGMKTLNGDLLPWRLRSRPIPMPISTPCHMAAVHSCSSPLSIASWTARLVDNKSLKLPANSSHNLEIQADVHSTAFLAWTFTSSKHTSVKMRITYSEGYELQPDSYPFERKKADRLDSKNGFILGPYDEVILDIPANEFVKYEPFWFRTFRIMRLEIEVGAENVELTEFEATQVNYPMSVKGSFDEEGDEYSARIWDVSVRTMRNCMFDGYNDCPFYEQLQYSGDTRAVGLFHYLISGDDRLMRFSISTFASSIHPSGLTHSRFPSHIPQLIAGFSLYWILQVCDHHLFFGDSLFSRSFLPRIDGVLEFFDQHIDEFGLVSGLPYDVWQYVDWVTGWAATDEHEDKGVPTSGRKSNRHTYFSILYAYVLQQFAKLVRDVGRPAHATEYEERAEALLLAIRKHCYDGEFFTDSTADIAGQDAYSQHSQVFAVLCGAALPGDRARILLESFADEKRFSKCSYMMKFYAFRAFAIAGDEVYGSLWKSMLSPYRKMLDNNLTTWEEDDVRQRSDCHAWGSVPLYEYCTEIAGLIPIKAGCQKVLFKPRLGLSRGIEAKIALGKDNLASVSWRSDDAGRTVVKLRLERKVEVVSHLPDGIETEHGVIDSLSLVHES